MLLPAPCLQERKLPKFINKADNLQASYVDALSNLIAIGRGLTDKQIK